MNLLLILLALIAGMGLAVQAAVNTRLSIGIGGQPLLAALISFAIGTICLLVVALFTADWSTFASQADRQVWWRWTGGALGACFVTASIFLAPRIGITHTVFLFIIGQLATGVLIDTYGLLQMPVRPVHWWKHAGLLVMLAGLSLFMFGDRLFGRT